MIRRMRDRALVTTGVVLVGLLVSTPDAGASGNCYNYGTPGYGQVFTDISYRGDCFEWPLHWGTVHFPDYTKNKASSFRSWSGYPGRSLVLRDSRYPASGEYIRPNEWKPSLYHDDAADYVELSV
ncbi:hypothetical protein [Saccharothrix longispora]|uniref:hypothetical protein n=1 Tax=Saccharothrix longispora TaxID=33920 RepID=UPI0028FD2BB6|nr:hypothetical protein [Saccharothrix longispora]MDU0295018.1 hypothetical protein [Saccharothrix longispora]